ncbi:chlorite dismutase [Elstera litoralis]|uniref:Chlorite dismutase n=1 Tax=Elstera litoralis TaxID=552518 RepID=A0A0F3IPW5_9PROT|nr:chlorite dismutase family protein [Elstera litoralis]KJV08776.1 chlorite dismutase [Elstera litoralis]
MNVNPRLYRFIGGNQGEWSVLAIRSVIGETLPMAARLAVVQGNGPVENSAWALSGVTSYGRYATQTEQASLAAVQVPPGRAESTCAALIPIKKNAAWWNLTQDARRQIFEERSRHTAIGVRYLPAIARRLHHCRDLAEPAPFDFLTWFDYAADQTQAFEDLVGALRQTEEWAYVEREVDIRLTRAG